MTGKMRSSALILTLISLLLATSSQAKERGILNQKAGEWGASDWIQLPKGKTNLSPADFNGKVLYLYCFQSWCPGCHKHGFPTLKKMGKRYEKADDVAFVAIQTVFEGFGSNPPKRVKEMAKRYDFTIPMGHSGKRNEKSLLMKNYRTGGTPWVIIIDKKGVVRYNDFHISPEAAEELIDKLRQEK